MESPPHRGLPYDLLFGGVLLIALAGSIIAGFRASGMAFVVRDGLFSMAFALPWLLAAALFRNAARES